MKKEDQRSRLTKKLIEDAFIDILASKPINNVSVKEVCEKAQINRSTFYSYYEDIYALYDSIKDIIRENIQAYLESYGKLDKNYNFYNEIFRFFIENKKVVKIFIGMQVDNEFVAELLQMAEDKVYSIYKKKYLLINERKFRNYFTFASMGCIGIINKWIKDGMKEDFETIAKIAEEISIKGIKYMY